MSAWISTDSMRQSARMGTERITRSSNTSTCAHAGRIESKEKARNRRSIVTSAVEMPRGDKSFQEFVPAFSYQQSAGFSRSQLSADSRQLNAVRRELIGDWGGLMP